MIYQPKIFVSLGAFGLRMCYWSASDLPTIPANKLITLKCWCKMSKLPHTVRLHVQMSNEEIQDLVTRVQKFSTNHAGVGQTVMQDIFFIASSLQRIVEEHQAILQDLVKHIESK